MVLRARGVAKAAGLVNGLTLQPSWMPGSSVDLDPPETALMVAKPILSEASTCFECASPCLGPNRRLSGDDGDRLG